MISHLKKMFSRSALIWFMPPAAVYVLEIVVFKAFQTARFAGGFSPLGILRATFSDLAFVISILFISQAIYAVKGKWPRRIGISAYFLIMTLSMIVSTFSHGYFMATGSNISWSTIQYWLNNMSASNTIIASEAASWKVALIAMQVLFVAACALLPLNRRIRKWAQRQSLRSTKGAVAISAIGILVFVCCLIAPNPKGKVAAVSRSVPLSIAKGAVREAIGDLGSVHIADSERQDGNLKFKTRPGTPRPNIVFIIFESLSWKASDIHTPGIGTTPFLASIKDKSAIIDYSYSIVPHTTKAVMPMLCGIYPYFKTKAVEATPGILPKRCLAHILGDVGYRTAFFQPAYDFENRSTLVANMGYEIFKGAKDFPKEGFESISYFGAEDKAMVTPSMDWVNSVKDKPFFLTYLTLATHHNYITPQSFPYVDFGKKDKDENNYMNAVRYVDDFIKEVFKEFESRGLIDNTVFIIAGDHGEAFAEHGRRQHDLVMWDEGLRTTALIYAPKFIKGGTVIDGIRSNLDFAPTVCDLLGIELQEGDFIGKSLLQPVPKDRKLYYSCWFNNECLAVKDGSIKTIYHYDSQSMEVYDNFKDPFELNNLAGKEPFDDAYLTLKTEEMLRYKRVLDQQYEEWSNALAEGKVTKTKPRMAREIEASFSDVAKIVGIDAPMRAVAGQDIKIRYLFQSLKKASSSDMLFVHVIQSSNYINADHIPVGGTMPLDEWRPGDYVLDEQTIHIPSTWEKGKVQIYVGVWNKRTKKRYKVEESKELSGEGRVLAAVIDLDESSKSTGLSEEEIKAKIGKWVGFEQPEFKNKIGAIFGDSVELTGVTLDRIDVMLAGTVEMTYVFKSIKEVSSRWRLSVSLVRNDGFEIKGDHIPIGGLYPVEQWRPGEYIVDKHRIHIDMYRSKTGVYDIRLGFRDGMTLAPIQGKGDIDSKNRIKIGTVTISEKDARQ